MSGKAGTRLTKNSLRILCKAVSMQDLEVGARLTSNADRLDWESRMITKYGFKVA